MPNYVVSWERSCVVDAKDEDAAVSAVEDHLASLGVEAHNVQVQMTTDWPAELHAPDDSEEE